MAFLDNVQELAKQDLRKIVLPESNDPRVQKATEEILEKGLAKVVLVGNEKELMNSSEYDLTGAEFIDPASFSKLDNYIDELVEIRKKKGLTKEQAKELLMNPLYFGCMLVKQGDADGMVGGAANSTADMLRPALQVIGTAKGVSVVSSAFLMEVPNCEYGANGMFIFADVALNPNPNAEQLAHIAKSSAVTFESLVHEEAVVAMLSFSTRSSANHPDVDKMIDATKKAKEIYPELKIDGEMQLDAAIVPAIGNKKAPDSDVAGKANVLVFPDLDAGNIGYKLVQRLAKANAFGPFTQGLAKPVNDLSRGCSADDIVGTVAITALQAQNS
ncbi:phosphate acetyltransferase [Clostridiaceae bacterium HSG29]|nr:phosphate acetyltransferase [Clostridiaceae bacterium HSG29]